MSNALRYTLLVTFLFLPWAKENRIICDLQGTDQDHCSSMHTSWILSETIACSRENGKSVYVGLLDISKAFDSVWIDGMLYQLYNTGLDGKLWRIIRSFYKDFMCSIQIGPFQSESSFQSNARGTPRSLLVNEVV